MDTLILGFSSEEGVLMGRPSKYSPEFREQAVELVRASDKTTAEVARDLKINDTTLGNWVKADRAERGEPDRTGLLPLTAEDRAELTRLRRENAKLKTEREILKKAAVKSTRQRNTPGPDTAAEMLIVAGDNPDRIRSEPAFARLCGVAPIPASSGMTTRHRLSRGGHRQANAALYRVVIVRMQHHEPTRTYVARRITEGKTKAEIIRCLKRLLARELWAAMRPLRTPRQPVPNAA